MSGSIENLLVRNLREVFRGARARPHGPRPRSKRYSIAITSSQIRAASMSGSNRGRCGFTLLAQFPDHVFSQIGSVDAPQDSGRLAWAFGPPHQPRQITGLDVAVVNAGRISAVYTFLDPTGA